MTKNYYEILGVLPNADLATIQQAAQSKARQVESAYKALSDAEKQTVHQKMQEQANEISVAFKILSDPSQREAYDAEVAQIIHHAEPIGMSINEAVDFSKPAPDENSFAQRLIKKLTTFEPPSIKDIAIFALAVAFFAYMVSGFFIPKTERLARSAESTLQFRGR